MCHPYGDQAMPMWINNIPSVTYFGDPRVQHNVPNPHTILQNDDICETFLAIHGSYPPQVKLYWEHQLNIKKRKSGYTIPSVTYPCGNMDKTYNYKIFGGMYHAKPKPCKEKPVWRIGDFYRGRSGK